MSAKLAGLDAVLVKVGQAKTWPGLLRITDTLHVRYRLTMLIFDSRASSG